MPVGSTGSGSAPGMPASLGDVPVADGVVPVAGEQAEAGSAAYGACGARGRSLSEVVSWLTLA